jgi:2-amino-4-hydroxy-6-hydroxymethyldihydropteridine diphosphokinase
VTVAYVGIGSNLEDPHAQVTRAFGELAAMPHTRLLARSSLYRSAPVGYASQPEFINAVAQVDTEMNSRALLSALRTIEEMHGRKRTFANAPRTLDLDLLLYGDENIQTSDLVVPHPRMRERAFVLKPLLEINPELATRFSLEACAGQDVERIA